MAAPYLVNVGIALSSNHGTVLGALAKHLGGIHTHVNQLTGKFNSLKLAISGALAVGAGMGLLHAMIKLVDKTKEYSHELTKLERMGGAMGRDVRSGAAANLAFDVAAKSNLRVTDVMKIQGPVSSILGPEGKKVLEPFAKFAFQLHSDKSFKGDAGAEFTKFLRSGEISGRLADPKTHKAAIDEVERFLNLSSKIISATHGTVTPSTLLALTQRAGFTMRGMTDKGFMTEAIMAQAMGGHQAGTATMTLFQQLATGKGTPAAAKAMVELGLLKAGEVHKEGARTVVDPKAQRRLAGILEKDPMDLVDTIYANLERRGVTDPAEQRRLTAAALSRATSQRFVVEMMQNRGQIKDERERMAEGLGSEAGVDLTMQKDVGANQEALSAAWDNLLMAVAGPNAENTIGVLQALTEGIKGFTGYMRSLDPNTVKNIAIGIGMLAGALTMAGGVALLAALGPAGWIALGAAGVAAAVYALSHVDWNKAKGEIASFSANARQALSNIDWGGIQDSLTRFVKQTSISLRTIRWDDAASQVLALAQDAIAKTRSVYWKNVGQPILNLVQDTFNVLGDMLGKINWKGIGDAIWSMVKSITDAAASLGVGTLKSLGIDKGGSHTSPGKTGKPAEEKHSMFRPATGTSKDKPISLALNIDGRTLAQAVSEQLAKLSEHNTIAPASYG